MEKNKKKSKLNIVRILVITILCFVFLYELCILINYKKCESSTIEIL